MKVTFILGTRPEVIKLAPVIQMAKARGLYVRLLHTGQHLQLTDPLLRLFGLRSLVDEFINLEAMLEKPSLTGLSARVLDRLDTLLTGSETDCVVVQGDTTSAFIGAYWAFCKSIPIAHVEAGLRTGDLRSPFPEEANRVLIGRLANYHFAPTPQAAEQLISEGISREHVFMTGNTSIDALQFTLRKIEAEEIEEQDRLPIEIERFAGTGRIVLVTAHRRENVGQPLERICCALRSICDADSKVRMVLPMHPNPNVRSQIVSELGEHPQILLCEPLSYIPFVQLMARSELLITDSGGVQEEGPTLRKPIIVIRESTERPEGVEAGFAKLAGSCPKTIFAEAMQALEHGCATQNANPYGDGRASARIIAALGLGGASLLGTETISAGASAKEHNRRHLALARMSELHAKRPPLPQVQRSDLHKGP